MDTFWIGHVPAAAADKVALRRAQLIWGPGYPWTFGLLSSLFTMTIVMVGLILMRTVLVEQANWASFALTVVAWLLFAVHGIGMVVAGIIRGLRWRRAISEAQLTAEGPALAIRRDGLQTATAMHRWENLDELSVQKSKFGWGWHFVATEGGTEVIRLPLDAIDATPAELDLVLRAFTEGSRGLDLRVIDHDVRAEVAPPRTTDQSHEQVGAQTSTMTD